MKAAVKTNFRGMRALVVLGNDSNRLALASVLGKLGLDVQLHDPHDAGVQTALEKCDVVLLDADVNLEVLSEPNALPDVPCIALIGTETPSQLARVVRQGCISHILKPVRSSGVFTALLLAVNEHEKRQKIAREMAVLRQRLAGRREVTAAILKLMMADGIDQDAAYERLRVEAMNRRMPIEELAREYLACDARAQGGGRRPRIKADDTAKKLSTNRRLRQ
ncbi:aliphatic amidase regulator [Roseovarius sp. A-2]|uniref:ANTAR domain-containing response regulator n=1 Tax=Roseovarius sp. A-2 TaxID=1570360 RepID=UPI0009D2CCD4|nr:ANTAR domain-containing protein [Roseovarius sp. A-2]GAW36906.1 aliphatic amidase regulator [Roseovarius sp. A-2]